MSNARSRAIIALVLAVAVSVLPACGGSNDQPSEERIARERKEAAEEARQKERIRQLEEQVARQRREGKEDAGAPATPPPADGAPSSATACGGGISVGPNTTCSFAQNVRDAYRESGGSSLIRVYSPVTKETYTMSCRAGATTVCTGGNNATVYFR